MRARIVHVERLTEARRHHKGLRVFVRDEAPLPSIESACARAARAKCRWS